MAKADPKLTPEEDSAQKESDSVRYWLAQIKASQKREKAWRKEARELIKIYEGELPDEIPYNILYSNTETLTPALYSSTPRPDTRPRTMQEGATAMAAAGVCDAYLENFIDNGNQEYCSFDSATKTAVRSALVPGRGCQRFHYHAEIESDAQGPRRVREECVNVEELSWDKVLFGYAKTWICVPWVSFEHVLTQDEAIELFDREAASKLTYSIPTIDDDEDSGRKADSEDSEPVAVVFEIWHKAKKEIIWVEQGAKDLFIKPKEPDPFKLEGFYPMQEPLQLMKRLSSTLPVPLYRLYKRQAAELNKITRRIDKVIEQIKIRGFYDAGVEGLAKVLESDDGVMIPITNLSSMGQGAKADGAVWLVPVEKHVTVLQQLLQDRQAIKQVIFEVMGIADIMRGSSVASETLGAQKIKNQWGTLRLKDAQAEVAKFIRDGLRIAAELGFSKMAPETLRKITGSTLPAAAQLQQMEQQMMAAKAAGQQPPPEMLAQMALPSFEECVQALKDDLVRGYLIDIETNSSVDADASEDKQNVSEFLTAFSQFLNGAAPMIESGALPFEAAKAIMLSVCKRFNLGRQLYRELSKMQAPKAPGGPDPKVVKQLQDAQSKVAQDQKALEEKARAQETEKIKFDAEKRVYEIQKAADAAIAQAQQQARQVQSTAQGAAKAAQDKAAKVKDTADMQKMMSEINALLQTLQSTAEKSSLQSQMQAKDLEAASAEETAGEDKMSMMMTCLKEGFSEMGKQINEGLVKAASVKRVAVKGKDGWSSQAVQ
jgi:hypothetical protein